MAETRKVVINACFGGYNLSWAAAQFIAKRRGLVASYYHLSPDSHQPFGPDDFMVAHVIGPRSIGRERYDVEDKDAFVDPEDLPRDDPDVVAAVETLGSEKASGKLANLRVVEIPADVEWVIDEYDGNEYVEEAHRTWR